MKLNIFLTIFLITQVSILLIWNNFQLEQQGCSDSKLNNGKPYDRNLSYLKEQPKIEQKICKNQTIIVKEPCETITTPVKVELPNTSVLNNPIWSGNEGWLKAWPVMAVGRKYDYLYCAAGKVGSSTLKNILRDLEGDEKVPKIEVHDKCIVDWKWLGKNHITDKNETLQILTDKNRFKFTFMRNPYERMASFWTSAFSEEKDFLGIPANYSFFETIDYLWAKAPIWTWDLHYMPITFQCGVYAIDYDFIGDVKNFEKDAKFIFKKMGVEKEVEITHENNQGLPENYFDGMYDEDHLIKVGIMFSSDLYLMKSLGMPVYVPKL